jgi:hypothetical protein
MIRKIIAGLKNIFGPEPLPGAGTLLPGKSSFFGDLLARETLPHSLKNETVKQNIFFDLIIPEKIPLKEKRA